MIVSERFLSRNSRSWSRSASRFPLLVQPVPAQIGYVGEPGAEADVAHAYERLRTLRERVGQLLMVGWNGCGADETLEALVTDYAVGGVILFEYNIRGMRDSCPDSRVDPSEPDPVEVPQNAARLTNFIQNLASRTPAAIPVLVAVDQEQGRSQIIEKGMTRFPSAMALGATRNEDLAYRAGLVTGRELSAVGINMNLAPVSGHSPEHRERHHQRPFLWREPRDRVANVDTIHEWAACGRRIGNGQALSGAWRLRGQSRGRGLAGGQLHAGGDH